MRRLMNRIGADTVPLLFLLQEADLLAQSDFQKEEKLKKLAAARRCYLEIREANDAVTVKDLAVNGRDLMALGVKPGPMIGETLQKLLEEVMAEPEKNEKEQLLSFVKKELNL
jgi:tRNA nucleotidyltransferase (CCA-adding enzyme)